MKLLSNDAQVGFRYSIISKRDLAKDSSKFRVMGIFSAKNNLIFSLSEVLIDFSHLALPSAGKNAINMEKSLKWTTLNNGFSVFIGISSLLLPYVSLRYDVDGADSSAGDGFNAHSYCFKWWFSVRHFRFECVMRVTDVQIMAHRI